MKHYPGDKHTQTLVHTNARARKRGEEVRLDPKYAPYFNVFP